MIFRKHLFLLPVLLCTACAGPRCLRGYTYVASPKYGARTLRQAEVWLVSGRDTLRQEVDSAGRFCFERVPRRNWFLDGRHPHCTPPEPAVANWLKNPRQVIYDLKFYDRGITSVDTTSLLRSPRPIRRYRPPLHKLRLRHLMPRRWVMAGTVFDSDRLTFFGGAVPSGVEGATVFFVHGGDTLRTRTDRWGRFFIEGMCHEEYDVWAEKEGYRPSTKLADHPLRKQRVRPYSQKSGPEGIVVNTHVCVELLMERVR